MGNEESGFGRVDMVRHGVGSGISWDIPYVEFRALEVSVGVILRAVSERKLRPL